MSASGSEISFVKIALLGGGLENGRHWAQQANGQFAGNRGRIKGEKRAHPARLAAGLADDARAHPSRQRLRLQSRALSLAKIKSAFAMNNMQDAV